MLVWSKNLELKIGIIDNQHKEIFDVINKLIIAFDEQNELEEAYDALCFVEEYVQKHFQTEEFYLRKFEYKELEAHIKLHKAFSDQLKEFKTSWRRSGITRMAAIQMADFLVIWWNRHILEVDSKYVSWIADKIKTTKPQENFDNIQGI